MMAVSGLSKQRVSMGDRVEEAVRIWTILYLGNKTFYWFSDVDLKKFNLEKKKKFGCEKMAISCISVIVRLEGWGSHLLSEYWVWEGCSQDFYV